MDFHNDLESLNKLSNFDLIESQIIELDTIHRVPRLYLANYFIDLKCQIDFEFQSFNNQLFQENISVYKEIIKHVEHFETQAFKSVSKLNINCYQFPYFKSINYSQNFADEIKLNLEQCIFQDRSIYFFSNFSTRIKQVLLILDGKYIRKNKFQDCFFTKNNLRFVLSHPSIKDFPNIFYIDYKSLSNEKCIENNKTSIFECQRKRYRSDRC